MMRYHILNILVILFLGCNITFCQDWYSGINEKYPLKQKTTHCKGTPDKILKKTLYYYDNNCRLIESISFSLEPKSDSNVVIYQYNDRNLLASKISFTIDFHGYKKDEESWGFKYNDKDLLDFESHIDRNGNEISFHLIYSEHGNHIKTIQYINSEKHIFTYEYDKSGYLETEHIDNVLEKIYDFNGDLLVKTTIVTDDEYLDEEYSYDENGDLISVKLNGHTILENQYIDRQLVEQSKFNTHRITATSRMTCSYFLYKFEYY